MGYYEFPVTMPTAPPPYVVNSQKGKEEEGGDSDREREREEEERDEREV